MPYCIEPADGTITAMLHRVAGEEIADAIALLDGADQAELVHQARRRTKYLRGLLRLVRPVFGAFREENAALRDASLLLDRFRDARVRLDTYDSLIPELGQSDNGIDPLREQLAQEHDLLLGGDELAFRLGEYRERMSAIFERSANWTLEAEGFAAWSGGMAGTLRRARHALATAARDGSAESRHELRKRIKYHAMHCRLLLPVAPRLLDRRRRIAGEVDDLLGEDHDLTMLSQWLAGQSPGMQACSHAQELLQAADKRARKLSKKGISLSGKLLSGDGADLPADLEGHWQKWSSRHWGS